MYLITNGCGVRGAGRTKSTYYVWRSPGRGDVEVITLTTVLLVMQIMLAGLVAIKQLTGRP
ncbi:hypothetical protein TUM2330_36110 [Escherichia coli]|nr:hypothetical protein TUM2330_36110 [Escherichia coli]